MRKKEIFTGPVRLVSECARFALLRLSLRATAIRDTHEGELFSLLR